MRETKPKIVEVDPQQVEEILRRAEEKLDPEDFRLIHILLQAYLYVLSLVQAKNTTIGRLRKMLFGSKTEKTANVVGESAEASKEGASTSTDGAEAAEPSGDSSNQAESGGNVSDSGAGSGSSEQPEASSGDSSQKKKRRAPGHGRNGADDFPGADQVYVPHDTLQPGDPCPNCGRGTVYESRGGVLIRFVGQAPLHATVYRLQKLRCHTCGKVFTAPTPEDVSEEKYDATAVSMIALLKYGSGMPFNRLEGLQRNLGIPLPASTQWEVIFPYAAQLRPVFQELIRQAAQGKVFHHDDTAMKILSVALGREQPAGDSLDPSRTGAFTSGVVSICEGHRIALFFTGRQHAGENLRDVLKHRAAELDKPIQMCDASSRNMPEDLQTILSNCLAHGRREFVDIYDSFPDECRYVLEALKVVYKNDADAREQEMSPQERLEYHQKHSGPTMDALKEWLQRQFDEKLVEPNSPMGQAIRYMQNHWDELTLFLRVAGAPLDNNICERALKKAILHRKNSYFYKTLNGAYTGDLYMSLIYTCELCGVNANDYLNAIHGHIAAAVADPAAWMPWNYRSALEHLQPAAPAAA